MSEDKKKVPKLRFPEFEGEWEEKPLKELCSVYDGTHRTPNYTQKGVMFLSVEDIKTLHSEKYISYSDFEKEFRVFPQRGDILMTRIGDIGTANVVESDEPIAYYVSLALIKNGQIDSYFLKGSIATETVQRDIWKRTLHIAFPQKINMNEVANILISFPKCVKEQKAIGMFLRLIEQYIELQHKKLDDLKKLRESLLQKLFPQSEKEPPELRFPPFKSEWITKKMGDLMTVGSVKRIHQEDWEKTGVRFLRARDIIALLKNEEPEEYLYISQKKYEEYSKISGKLSLGDVLVTGVGSVGIPFLVKDLKPLYFKDGNIIWFKNRNKIDGEFLYYSFLSGYIQKFIRKTSGMGTVETYTIENGKKTPLIFPQKEEQMKIGRVLHNLDELIRLHIHKLGHLVQLKKGLLQQMFI